MSMSNSSVKLSVKSAVEECGRLYNFDSKEALLKLGLEKSVSESVRRYVLPFDGKKKEGYCNGIVKNHGLYTQCEKKVKEGYCKGCEKTELCYGDIDSRMSTGLYEYKDKKGKSPKRYTEVLKKLKISKEEVLEYAKSSNIEINEEHLAEIEGENQKRGRPKSEKIVKEVNGKKGRPKKEKKVIEIKNEEEDLFATLIANANANANGVEEAKEEVMEEDKDLSPPFPKVEKKAKKVKEVDPAKEAEKQKKAEEKAAKEAEKQKKAEEKAAKEAEKQKKAQEKATKEAEKQKKAQEKATKEAEKQKKAQENAEKVLAPPLQKDEEEADVVKKFEHEGKTYYKSKKSGMIYNMDQELVGKWNEERNAIELEEEEEEEEYDE